MRGEEVETALAAMLEARYQCNASLKVGANTALDAPAI
jgi:hypothetical protein